MLALEIVDLGDTMSPAVHRAGQELSHSFRILSRPMRVGSLLGPSSIMHRSAATSLPADRRDRKRLGAWYTPPALVEPLVTWAVRSPTDVTLDPAAGDGGFLVRTAARLRDLGAPDVRNRLVAVDINPAAIAATNRALRASGVVLPRRHLICSDFFEVDPTQTEGGSFPRIDAVIGNPPYIRYQTFAGTDRQVALERAARVGVRLSSLTSSWAPFVVHASSFLRKGGRLALVLPAELVHAGYAGEVRAFLRRSFHTVTILDFEDHVFPDSQERVILILAEGREVTPAGRLRVGRVSNPDALRALEDVLSACEVFPPSSEPGKWEHGFEDEGTRLLDRMMEEGLLVPLGEIGKASIGYVSGANAYFVLRPSSARKRGFPEETLVPTLVSAKQASGAVLSNRDLRALARRDEPCLLWTGGGTGRASVRRYIAEGEALGIASRFKCRSRSPWYIVPGVVKPAAFLTYMSGLFPRLVLNAAGAVCSNNLHAVQLGKLAPDLHASLVGAFYNSATMLSAERIGRRYGGGVLKLEPSEADRLLVPSPEVLARWKERQAALRSADLALRATRVEEVLEVTDDRLFGSVLGWSGRDLEALRASRRRRVELRLRLAPAQGSR